MSRIENKARASLNFKATLKKEKYTESQDNSSTLLYYILYFEYIKQFFSGSQYKDG